MDNELDWIEIRKKFKGVLAGETPKERLMRKVKENPFVPIGCLATFCALSRGLWFFRIGERRKAQKMMRARILAQGFTILSLVIGIGLSQEF